MSVLIFYLCLDCCNYCNSCSQRVEEEWKGVLVEYLEHWAEYYLVQVIVFGIFEWSLHCQHCHLLLLFLL